MSTKNTGELYRYRIDTRVGEHATVHVVQRVYWSSVSEDLTEAAPVDLADFNTEAEARYWLRERIERMAPFDLPPGNALAAV